LLLIFERDIFLYMATITIPKTKVKKEGGIVILSLKEYQKLCERATPTFYLKGKEAEALDKLVEEGLKNHNLGKTKKIKSLRVS